MARLFGTDGVRGRANTELTPKLAYLLGRAATIYFGNNGKRHPTFFIGRDTRISGSMLEAALATGICTSGGNVESLGIIPTPGVAYLARKKEVDAGIVISASHNPFFDNGIKFFGGNGYKLADEIEDNIADIVHQLEGKDDFYLAKDQEIGKIEYDLQAIKEYEDFLFETIQGDFKGLHIVLDCANGAAYEIMPRVLERLGAKVTLLHARPTGFNINDSCGSTHMEILQKKVVELQADFGIAHDGDADRCLCVDEEGKVIDGDHLLILFGIDLQKKGKLKNNTIVSTVMANIGFHKAAKEHGINVEVTKVGDRYVLENMLAHDYTLGGEQSGHIIFREFATTGDGLLTGLQILAILRDSKERASTLGKTMTTYPQVLLNVKVEDKEAVEKNPQVIEAVKKAEARLKNTGRILLRPSGTEPLIRIMAEGTDEDELHKICDEIADIILKL